MAKKSSAITWVDILILLVSIGLYIFSLSQKGVYTDRETMDSWQGGAMVIAGFLNFGCAPSWFPWLANPALITGWLFYFTKLRTSLVFSIIATVLCLSFLSYDQIIVDSGGNFSPIIGYGIGYWVWTASAAALLQGNMVRYFIEKHRTPTEEELMESLEA